LIYGVLIKISSNPVATLSASLMYAHEIIEKAPFMYRALTRDIEVSVEPYYLPEQSDPEDSRYVWGYRVVITNHSSSTVCLVSRYWNITDQNGQVDEVNGPGVVGDQPRLTPGETYEYSSGCPLDTPSGMMFGHYNMSQTKARALTLPFPHFRWTHPIYGASSTEQRYRGLQRITPHQTKITKGPAVFVSGGSFGFHTTVAGSPMP
jgi:ApaG protein